MSSFMPIYSVIVVVQVAVPEYTPIKRNTMGVGVGAMKSMVDGCESWSLVQECRELEEGFGTHLLIT